MRERPDAQHLFARALVAFLLLPGVVAFVIPWLVFPRHWPPHGWAWVGLVPLSLGVSGLALTVRAFYVRGRGTLAPWAPPVDLVVSGVYRWSRNPMYVAVVAIVLGWALLFRSWPIGWYAAGLAVLFHARVMLGEEPWLARTHGPRWEAYRAAVPRWCWRRSRD